MNTFPYHSTVSTWFFFVNQIISEGRTWNVWLLMTGKCIHNTHLNEWGPFGLKDLPFRMGLTLAVFCEYENVSSIHKTARYQLWNNFNNKFQCSLETFPHPKIIKFVLLRLAQIIDSGLWKCCFFDLYLFPGYAAKSGWKKAEKYVGHELKICAPPSHYDPPTVTRPEQNWVFMEYQRVPIRHSTPVIVQFSSAVLLCCAFLFHRNAIASSPVNRQRKAYKTKQKKTYPHLWFIERQIENCIQWDEGYVGWNGRNNRRALID